MRERSGKGITSPLSCYREKLVVIHHIGSSLLQAIKVHPLASPEDTVLLRFFLSKVFQPFRGFKVGKAMLVMK